MERISVPGEKKLKAKGVSFVQLVTVPFNGRNTVVVGRQYRGRRCYFAFKVLPKGLCNSRSSEFNAQRILQENLKALENVEILTNHQVLEIVGEDKVEGIKSKNKETGEEKQLDVEGVL